MSLTTRISLITALLLTVCIATAGIVLYSKVGSSLRAEAEARCRACIALLESHIKADDGRLELDETAAALWMHERWRITTMDGTLLWSNNYWNDDAGAIAITRDRIFGDEGSAIASGKQLQRKELKDKDDEGKPRIAYQFPEDVERVSLRLSVQIPMARVTENLLNLSIALWTIGPLTVLIGSLLMGAFIRWQLRPLTVMAHEAATIGPENTAARIGPAGTSSECVQLRASVNRMVERLAAGMERERQFAAVAAHELRSPLAQLRTSMEVTLRKERDSGEYRQNIEECLRDVQRLQTLAANLLLITRGFDAEQCRSATTQLQSAVERARRECNSDAVVTTSIGPELLVRGREELLVAALRNVLENARRYAPGAPASIAVQAQDKEVRLIVRDAGPGIAAQDRERIFDPLVRLDLARTIKDDAHGFGLGLTVARAAIRACGGELVCKPPSDASDASDAKTGAVFEFSFPI